MKIQSIKIEVSVIGRGVINWNGSNGKYLLPPELIHDMGGAHHNNITCPRFKVLGADHYLVDSSNCVKSHTIDPSERQRMLTIISSMKSKESARNLNMAIAEPANLLCGYLITSEGDNGLKRNATAIFSDCVTTQVVDFIVEENSARGERDSTSYFKKIVPAQDEFGMSFSVFVDLSELGFVAASSHHNRQAIEYSERSFFEDAIERKYGVRPSLSTYIKKNEFFGCDEVHEEGYTLDREVVAKLLEFLHGSLSGFNVIKSQGRREVQNIQCTVKYSDGVSSSLEFEAAVHEIRSNGYYSRYVEGTGSRMAEYAEHIKTIEGDKKAKADKKKATSEKKGKKNDKAKG